MIDLKAQKIKLFIDAKAKVLQDATAFVNEEKIDPTSIGSEILNDGRLFMSITYKEGDGKKTYSLKESLVGNVKDIEGNLSEKIHESMPDANIACHEMFVDNQGDVYFIYLIEN